MTEERKPKHKLGFYIFLAVDALLLSFCIVQVFHPIVQFGTLTFFNPQGAIALKERDTLVKAVLIMALAVIPVYLLLFFIIWKYRADKANQEYSPNSQSTLISAFILWAIPILVITAVGVLNWQSTHQLDPANAIPSKNKPLTIQVVALQWKWLFVYPDQNIATVNFVEFPENTPVNFQLTADGPMSSLWIPQLGSQIYAMAAMSTQLHLIADHTGNFMGEDTEINGTGFSGMKFVARSASKTDFNAWEALAKQSGTALDLNAYDKLAAPSENNPTATYSSVEKNLYNEIMMKYMMPASPSSTSSPMEMH